MSSYKIIQENYTVEEGLDTMEIQDLRDEMQDWVDNMSGTGLENTNRYEMAEEAVSQLDDVDSIDFEEIWNAIPEDCPITEEELKAIKYTCILYTPKSKKQQPSRSYRLANALSHIRGALQAIEDYLEDKKDVEGVNDILQVADDIGGQVGDLDSVDFPGMFG